MNLFQKIKQILFSPNAFFQNLKEKGIKEPFTFLLTIAIISSVVGSIINVTLYKNQTLQMLQSFQISLSLYSVFLILAIGSYILIIIMDFINAFFLRIYLRLFKGKKPYSDAYRLLVYSFTPTYLFGWIPFVSILALIYSFILLIIGTHKMYKFSPLKATLIYVIPLIIMLFLALILGILFFLVLLYAGNTQTTGF